MTGIRYFSESNPWIDFVVFASEKDKEDAKLAIIRGMDNFWEDGDICYGDAVLAELNQIDYKGDIKPFIVFIDESLPESMWEEYLDFVKNKYGLETM